MISESPTYPNERPTVADSSEHANAQRLEKRKVLHDRGPGEPPPPKRLRPTLDTTRLRSRKKVFWALPEELMELICQYVRLGQVSYEFNLTLYSSPSTTFMTSYYSRLDPDTKARLENYSAFLSSMLSCVCRKRARSA